MALLCGGENCHGVVAIYSDLLRFGVLLRQFLGVGWYIIAHRHSKTYEIFMTLYIKKIIKAARKQIWNGALRLARWAEPALEIEVIRPLDYRKLGLQDAVRGGWYNEKTAELGPGFTIADSDTVVDVGCGEGANIHFCARFASHVIAIDIDPTRAATTKARLQSGSKATYAVVLSDANPIPIESATADKVVCTEVLEHVDDPVQVLSELVRIGKPGATYLLSVPDALTESVMKRVGSKAIFEKPHHIRIIQRDEFEQMVINAGLIIKNHTYRSFYWAVWFALSWRCGVSIWHGRHPVLDHWARTWNAVLELPHGQDCKDALDMAMPKSQVIVASKL
jgi:ubiquinone/menaquinone biosynthesis C-methylase UbiE